MDILLALGSFTLGAVLCFWPSFFRKLSAFFDTLIHEAGHGAASLPFGAPLPSITVRKNTSGETQSTMGYLHQLLPFGLGKLTEKFARTTSLMAGYSASIILASVLLSIAILDRVTFEPWHILFIAQVALATLLWTLVKITDSPWTFLLIAGIVTVIYIRLLPFDWRFYGLILLAIIILFFIAKSWLGAIAVLLTLSAPLTVVSAIAFSDFNPESFLGLNEINLTVSGLWLSRIIFALLLVFLAFCCRSWLSLLLTVVILGSVLALLFAPWITYSYVLFAVAGLLTVAGVRSLLELHRLTFSSTKGTHWQKERSSTDMVFASQEIGGDPRFWYWVQVAVAVLGALGILVRTYFV